MESTLLSDLLSVFVEARRLLASPDNDFSWSGWENGNEALREIDDLISKLREGELPNPLHMRALFAPTGPIRDVSISSGWGDAFLALAEAFDRATERTAE